MEDETTDDGREELGEGVEDDGLGQPGKVMFLS